MGSVPRECIGWNVCSIFNAMWCFIRRLYKRHTSVLSDLSRPQPKQMLANHIRAHLHTKVLKGWFTQELSSFMSFQICMAFFLQWNINYSENHLYLLVNYTFKTFSISMSSDMGHVAKLLNCCWCKCGQPYVTLEHKTSHKGPFFEIEIYTSSESWINSFPLMYGLLW